MNEILIDIINYKYVEIPVLKERYQHLIDQNFNFDQKPKFKEAFINKDVVKIIAEIKPTSPSTGDIFEPTKERIKEIVKLYNSFPVAAISILTDSSFFNGAFENITIAKEITSKPILCKEFIVDEFQLQLAKYFGADAVLLIAEALDYDRLLELYQYALSINLDVLFECHDKDNLEFLLNNNIDIIGINNRDLFTMNLDKNKSYDFKKHIPEEKICIAESGYNSKEDIKKLAESKFNGVLIGSSILKSDNMEEKLKELVYYYE